MKKNTLILPIAIGTLIGSTLTGVFVYLFEITFIDFVRDVFSYNYSLTSKIIIYGVIWVFFTSASIMGCIRGHKQ